MAKLEMAKNVHLQMLRDIAGVYQAAKQFPYKMAEKDHKCKRIFCTISSFDMITDKIALLEKCSFRNDFNPIHCELLW